MIKDLNMDNSVTVITLTRKRPELLIRAINSVKRQDYPEIIEHMIIIDDCLTTKKILQGMTGKGNIVWHYTSRKDGEYKDPSHIAGLRNYSVINAKSKWISFLDDDNEFEPHHISSLIACAQKTGCRAVHSYMKIYLRDGVPYLEQKMPWCRDPEEAKKIYADLCDKGVLRIGSNIVRDRADSLDHPDPARTVDTGEWLLDRSLLLEFKFPTEYDEKDWQNITTEDDKLMKTLIENRVSIACTKLPTLRYYLGGYSNNLTPKAEAVDQNKIWIID